MDTSVIEVNKVVTLSSSLGGTSSFTKAINNVSFIPDVVIVNSLNYFTTAGSENPALVYSDLVFDYLGSMLPDVTVELKTSFILDGPIQGIYKFELREVNGTLAARTGILVICLNFIKYKKVQEQKVY